MTEMSIYTYMAGKASQYSLNQCKAPGSVLLDSSHRERKVRGLPQTQEGILSMDRGDSFSSDTSSMWQQCLSYNSQNFGASQ